MASWCGATAAALGFLVIAAWHLSPTSVVRIGADFIEMRYVTALAFVLSGTALWGGSRGAARWPAILAPLAAALGALTLAEYLFVVDLGVDHLGPESRGLTSWPYPGRMAPNTAVAFLIAGVGVVLANVEAPVRTTRGAAVIAGCIVVGFATVTLLGYALGISVGAAGEVFLPVAIPTAAGILVLGAGIVARATHAPGPEPQGTSAWLPLGILVGGLAFISVLGVALAQREEQAIAGRLEADAKLVRVEAAESISAPIEEVTHEAEVLASTPEMTQVEFERAARRFAYGYGESNTLAWVVPSLGRVWVMSARGASPLRVPELVPSGSAFVAPDPADGRVVLWASVPLPGPKGAAGLLVGGIRIDEVLAVQFDNHGLSDDAVRLFDHGKEVYRYGRSEERENAAWSRTIPIEAPPAHLTATLHLTRVRLAALRSGVPLLVPASGAALFGLLALAVHLAARARARAREAQERSRELALEVDRHATTSDSLRGSSALLEGLFESAPDAIVVVDPSGRIVRANQRAVALFGWSRADLVGLSVEALVPMRLRERHAAHRKELLVTPEHPALGSRRDLSALHRDGSEFPVDVSLARLVSGQESLVIAVVRDVTDRRMAEAALHASEAQLRQAQKMEAVGRLAGGIAHDFNNLLCVILGYGKLVADALGPESPQAGFVEQIVRAAQGAEALTRQLLTFSRRQVLEPRVLDLNGVVRGVEKMLRRVIGEDISLVTELTPGPAVALVDAGHMEQVLMNLVVNARDAMPDGGRLTIRTAFVQGGGSWGTVPCEIPAGSRVVLSVTDTGTGMSAETQARLFEPFFTTKPQGRGTGLGLATVHGIVLQSGGQVCVSSSVGEGTEFRVYLPRLEGDVEGDRQPAVEVKAYDGHETVLLAEDQAPVLEIVRLWLERRGYRVLEAADGLQGIEVAAAHAGQVDLLVTDVIMPRASGKELARVLREKRPNLPVLYISGYTDDMVHQGGGLEPGTRLLDKPLSEASFLRAVRESLDGAPRPS